MVIPEGLEPPTYRLGICCSILMSYGTMMILCRTFRQNASFGHVRPTQTYLARLTTLIDKSLSKAHKSAQDQPRGKHRRCPK